MECLLFVAAWFGFAVLGTVILMLLALLLSKITDLMDEERPKKKRKKIPKDFKLKVIKGGKE